MAHEMGWAGIALMAAMMIVMGGFSLAALTRAVPAAWRGRLRHAIRRPTGLPGGTVKEGAR